VVWSQSNIEAAVEEFVKLEETTKLGRKKINGREAEGFEVKLLHSFVILSPFASLRINSAKDLALEKD